MTSARRVYRLNLGLASIAASAAALGVVLALTRIEPAVPSASALVAACRSVVPTEPGIGPLLVVLLGSAGLIVLVAAARSLARQLISHRRLLRALSSSTAITLDGRPLRVFESPGPEAFCAGLLRPGIYVSTAAEHGLTAAELRAVVAHESHHQRCRDPLRVLIATVVADAFVFVPGISALRARYRQLAELDADEAACEEVGRPPLASALLAFGQRHGQGSAVVEVAPERVDRLLGHRPLRQLPRSALTGSLIVLVAWLAAAMASSAVVDPGSVSPAALLAELCMLAMIAAPGGIAVAVVLLSRRRLRRAPAGRA